ncbi:hypothetical protein B9479_006118 [Cryptococcus floricola]|uniref:Charged multivesicular body protein 7 n=1 Tax=Cryptococcus floricola TaxID=2591691 RepID=A0A5D3ASR8_9TREE|nr:hypothetical protein B9479_006118 [Cryptococcus floricola]
MPDHLPPFLATVPPPTTPPSRARLQALYAASSTQRSSNPTGYAANAQWWAAVLEETLRSGWINGEGGDRLVVKVDEALSGRLEDEKGSRPAGLGGVVESLATTTPPTLHPLPHFLSSQVPLHLPPSMTSRFIGRPLWWAFGQLNPFGGGSDKVEKEETLWNRYGKGKEYAHMPLLEQSAAAFTAHMLKNPILSYTSSLFDADSFLEEYGRACFPMGPTAKKLPKGDHRLSRRDVEVLVKWLSRDCLLTVTDGSVIKVLDSDQVAADHPISEADRGAVSVMNALRKVELQIISIEQQIIESQQKAKKHLASGQKNIALSYLRSKKQLEDLLSKRVASSEQLRSVIRSIDQAKGDVEIMSAYETSTSTLTQILAHPSLSPDYVAQTTDALADAMADQSEIDDAVRVGGEVAMGSRRVEVDEDDLADELAALVEEEKRAEEKKVSEKREKEEATRAALEKPDLPTVPATAPSLPTEPTVVPTVTKPAVDEGLSEEETLWRQRYEESQRQKDAERKRFEEERLLREAKMQAAE